jgi:hypothetical protein
MVDFINGFLRFGYNFAAAAFFAICSPVKTVSARLALDQRDMPFCNISKPVSNTNRHRSDVAKFGPWLC